MWTSTCAFIFLCGGSKFHNCLPWAQRELSQQFRAAAAEEAVVKWADILQEGKEEKGKECGLEVQKSSVLEKLLKSSKAEKSRRKRQKDKINL